MPIKLDMQKRIIKLRKGMNVLQKKLTFSGVLKSVKFEYINTMWILEVHCLQKQLMNTAKPATREQVLLICSRT